MVEPEKKNRAPFFCMVIAVVMSVLIFLLKLYAAHISESSALRSDSLEGTVNVLAAVFGLVSVIYASKPADSGHPYGHGKIEYFASTFEGGLITLAGFLILIDTLVRVAHQTPLLELSLGLRINLFAGILNGLTGGFVYWMGKRHQSEILIADGLHLLTDLVTTLVMALGLVLVLATGWNWLDPALAFAASGFLLWTGFKLVTHASGALLDAQSPQLLQEIVDHLNTVERGSVITLHELRAQQFGRDKHVDIHLVLPEFLSIQEGHHASDRFVETLKKKLGGGSLIHVHVDPCMRLFCRECPRAGCPIRAEAFQKLEPFTLEACVQQGNV